MSFSITSTDEGQIELNRLTFPPNGIYSDWYIWYIYLEDLVSRARVPAISKFAGEDWDHAL